ncbi:MAG: hypothetical protein ACE5GU_14815 [Candidatus Scalinduaceae bacterium]
MGKELNPMSEIHEIQERIYEEQKCMTSKEKAEALHKEAEKTRKRFGLKIKKRVSNVSGTTSVVR